MESDPVTVPIGLTHSVVLLAVQVSPSGSVSMSVTLFAVPVPAALLLLTVIEKVAVPGGVTEYPASPCASGVFTMDRFGQAIVVLAEAVTLLTPEADPVAVFWKPPELQAAAAVVVALMTATIVAFCARFFGPQVSVPALMAHVASLPAPRV